MDDRENERKIEKKISKILDRDHLHYQQNVFVSGSSTDFYVEPPQGGTIVFNIKNWNPSDIKGFTADALADSIKTASGADYSYIIIPDYQINEEIPGVVTVSNVRRLINELPPKMKTVKPKVQKDEDYATFFL